MILNLDDRITNHIKLFIKITGKIEDKSAVIDLLNEFAVIGISFKKIQSLSKICDESETNVQYALQAILKLMEEASYLNLKEDELRDTLKLLNLQTDFIPLLLELYVSVQAHISDVNSKNVINEQTYKDLHWRIDIELSSKYSGNKPKPVIYLHLITRNPVSGKEEVKIFQTDPCNIRHLISELESAQKELGSIYCQRVEKYIK